MTTDSKQVDDSPEKSEVETDNSKNDEISKPSFVDEAKLNSAITNRLKAHQKSFEKMLDEKLSALTALGKDKPLDEKESEVKTLQKEVTKLRNEREQEKELARAEKLNVTVKTKLLDLGVEPKMIRSAIALLKEDKAIGYNEEGELVYSDHLAGESDLDSGLKSWIKSDEAKFYIPGKTIKGTGASDISTNNKKTNKLSEEEVNTAVNKFFYGR